MKKKSRYTYWVLKFPDTGLYVGKRSDSEPCTEVDRSKRIRYISEETALRAVKYFAGFNIKTKAVLVRVTAKTAGKKTPAATRVTGEKVLLGPPLDASDSYQSLLISPKRESRRFHFCPECGPMNACICHEDDLPPYP